MFLPYLCTRSLLSCHWLFICGFTTFVVLGITAATVSLIIRPTDHIAPITNLPCHQ